MTGKATGGYAGGVGLKKDAAVTVTCNKFNWQSFWSLDNKVLLSREFKNCYIFPIDLFIDVIREFC